MESWRLIWRNGFAKILPLDGLESLAEALRTDDQRLLQGVTTTPPPLMCVQDWPCEACDAVGWAGGFKGNPKATVGEVEEGFARACFDADQLLGEPAACRWLLNWFDDTPRAEMIAHLLPEVELAVRTRREQLAALVPVEIGGEGG